MRISELIAWHGRIPLRKQIRHASHTRSANDSLFVCCRLDDGTEGWGEGLPRMYVTGETIQSTFDLLHSPGWTRLIAEPFETISDLIALCEQFHFPAATSARRDCFGNAVRCAVELSILDATFRRWGRPLSDLAEELPSTKSIQKRREQVQYSGAITSASPFRELWSAWKMRYYGFHQCKVKVGVEGADDAALLKRVRWMLGSDVDIRIDANEAWTCNNLVSKLEPLIPMNVTAIEQPVPVELTTGLAAVRKEIPVPIMLDESLCSLTDGEKAIEQQTCDLFNIRISKCGGLINSLHLAAKAYDAGLGYQLGCQVGETGILSAAGRHFACSVGNIRYLEGSYDRHLVREALTTEDLTFKRRGIASAIAKPGLGIEIDRIALDRVKVREDHWKINV